jgi:phospholipid N-methyltransferase
VLTIPSKANYSLRFLRGFLREPRAVASVWPSSRHLAEAMLEGIDLAPGDVIVEYGPGTGSFTELIAERRRAIGGLEYVGIERSEDFLGILRARFPGMRFVRGRAEDAIAIVGDCAGRPPRVVISGLPLIAMPTMETVVAATSRLLARPGAFHTFSYVHSAPTPGARRLRAAMRAYFDEFEVSGAILRNIPPALVLRGRQRASGAA